MAVTRLVGCCLLLTSGMAWAGSPLALDAPLETERHQTRLDALPVSGTAAPGAGILVSLRGAPAAVATVGADGRFSFPALPLVEGDNLLVVTVIAGGAPVSLLRSIICDRTPPALRLDSPVAGAAVGSPDLLVAGASEPGQVVRCQVGEAVWAETAAADGRFRLVLANALVEGENRLVVKVADELGNERVVVVDVALDAQPPLLRLQPPFDGESAVVTGAAMLAGATEPGAGLAVLVNDEPVLVTTVGEGGEFIVGPIPFAEGENRLQLRVSDRVGNTLTVARRVLGDTTPPRLALAVPLAGGRCRTSAERLSVRGETEPGAAVELRVGHRFLAEGVAGGDGRFGFPDLTLADGENDVWVFARDAVGNEARAFCRVVLDRRPPGLTIVSPGPVEYIESPLLAIRGLTEPGATVRLASETFDLTVAADGAGRFHLADVPVTDGANSYTLTVSDDLGNAQAIPVVIVGRIRDPILALRSPVSATLPSRAVTVALEYEAGCTLTVSLDGRPLPIETVLPLYGGYDPPREVAMAAPGVLEPGPHELRAQVQSPSGVRRAALVREFHAPGAVQAIGWTIERSREAVAVAVDVTDRWGRPVADGTAVTVRCPPAVRLEGFGGSTAVVPTHGGRALLRVVAEGRGRKVVLVSCGWLTESVVIEPGG